LRGADRSGGQAKPDSAVLVANGDRGVVNGVNFAGMLAYCEHDWGSGMKKWAIRLLTYPVLFVLALIFIGPTIPIDISILIISSIVAAIGLSTDGTAFPVRTHIAAWRSKVLSLLRSAIA